MTQAPVVKRGGVDGVLDWYGGWLGQQLGETIGEGAQLADKANPIPELLDATMTAAIFGCVLALGGALIVVGTWRAVS